MSWRFPVLHYVSTFFQTCFKYSNFTCSSVTGKPKPPNFLFWRCCPQEHLAAFSHSHTKSKYWNTKMKRIQNLKWCVSGQNWRFFQIYILIFRTAGSLHPSKQRGLNIALDLKKTTTTPPIPPPTPQKTQSKPLHMEIITILFTFDLKWKY